MSVPPVSQFEGQFSTLKDKFYKIRTNRRDKIVKYIDSARAASAATIESSKTGDISSAWDSDAGRQAFELFGHIASSAKSHHDQRAAAFDQAVSESAKIWTA